MSEPLREKITSVENKVSVEVSSGYEAESCHSFLCHQYQLIESLASEGTQSYSFWNVFFF
ncbi:hypothetical protein [Vibrio mangrovi]|uniref:Uncharacterized protein n=1 Tax=Vibrio mangrovi TaxID=474394 RepID=A0A1Y6ISU4_9VIBR|nr:hypothetical protein [Vibrio mangrovi]MDW6003340.1 hypothetical protein [Vibrio mangrovi]SMR99870.1 hypothetical protein VIM7927_01105 [Vibrio mangrovi]